MLYLVRGILNLTGSISDRATSFRLNSSTHTQRMQVSPFLLPTPVSHLPSFCIFIPHVIPPLSQADHAPVGASSDVAHVMQYGKSMRRTEQRNRHGKQFEVGTQAPTRWLQIATRSRSTRPSTQADQEQAAQVGTQEPWWRKHYRRTPSFQRRQRSQQRVIFCERAILISGTSRNS